MYSFALIKEAYPNISRGKPILIILSCALMLYAPKQLVMPGIVAIAVRMLAIV